MLEALDGWMTTHVILDVLPDCRRVVESGLTDGYVSGQLQANKVESYRHEGAKLSATPPHLLESTAHLFTTRSAM